MGCLGESDHGPPEACNQVGRSSRSLWCQMREQAGIYVESLMRGPIEELWQRTQDPALHQRWDLRFTDISYLPRPDTTLPERFSYSTRIGFGFRIEGKGESVGTRDGPLGERTSALRFWSDDPKSLIREGSGYWKYVPTGDSVRFITWYDYKTRFGMLGRFLDAIVFRPLLGWATAWSFDRLRLWVERDIDPRVSLERSLVHATARIAIVLIFFYQGLVPKLLFRNPDELAMLADCGVPTHQLVSAITLLGVVEIAWALLLAFFGRSCWMLWLTSFAMILALLTIAIRTPAYLIAAFNPVTLNLAVIALCLIAGLTAAGRPSASRCLRKQSGEER
jgi:DoxX-like family